MKIRHLLTIGAASLLAAAAQGQQQLAKSIHDTNVETKKTAEQLQATLSAVNALATQETGDLRPAYNVFCTEVTNTQNAAELTRTRIQWMATDGEKHFQEWQNTIGSISNDSLRKKSQKRKDKVSSSYKDVEESLKNAAEKFKPFLSDLSDIQKTLALDVTPGGVKAVRSTVKSANWNNQSVSKAINSAIKGMDKMEKELSPEAK